MRMPFWPLTLLIGLCLGTWALPPASADDKPDTARIQKLIDQLGSDSFEDREAAVKALDAIGEPALELLRKAIQNGEPEVRKRAGDLIRKIERTTERNRVLSATRVHLVFKDTPVADAVAEFRKKTGYNLYLHDPEGKLKGRKVTLDTGETTFWSALEQFCQKAGLIEATPQDLMPRPVPPRRGRPLPADKAQEAVNQNRAEQAVPRVQVDPPPVPAPIGRAAPAIAVAPAIVNGQPFQITLVDGKGKNEAADVSSAVRVKALSQSDLFGTARAGEILLALEITPEPKLQWQQLLALRITRALDDQDQELKESAATENPGIVVPGLPGGGFARPAIRPVNWWGGLHQYAPVHLKKGDKAARSLKELTGTITAQLLTAPQALITADNILKNSGKTFKGMEEGSIKIQDVSKGANGTVTVRFELEQPVNVIPANGGGWGVPGGGIQIQPVPLPAVPIPVPDRGAFNAVPAQPALAQLPANRGVAVGQIQLQVQPVIGGPMAMPVQVGYNGIGLLDDKNNPVPLLVQQQINFRILQPGNKNVQEFVFVFQLDKGQSDDLKLVFLGRKQTTVDIPFTLKDVPLP